MSPPDETTVTKIDDALQHWRQGDFVLGTELPFLTVIDPAHPLTDEGAAAASGGNDLAEIDVEGLLVVSQTCDVVRSCATRPYVEVCPLLTATPSQLRQAERGRVPRLEWALRSLVKAGRLM